MTWASKVIHWDECDERRREMLRRNWSNGDLRYKLDESQKEVYDDIKEKFLQVDNSFDRRYVLDIARRWGKDFLMAVIAVETMLTVPKKRIIYGDAYQTDVRKILEPIIDEILMDCPDELRPTPKRVDCKWIGVNGSDLSLVGVDRYPDRLRGPGAIAVIFTEMAFMMNLEEGIMDAVMPQLLTNEDGFQLFGSTPPVTPVHPWTTKYIPQAKARKFYAFRTIDDCPRLTDTQRAAAIREAGGEESTRCRREYYCEHITEETLVVCPEWKRVKSACVVEIERPKYADCYGVLDPGWSHLAAHWFGYYNFERDWFVLEDEFAEQRKNSRQIAQMTAAREWQQWGVKPGRDHRMTEEAHAAEIVAIRSHFRPDLPKPEDVKEWPRWAPGKQAFAPQPFMRVSDTNMTQIADLRAEHGLTYAPTAKDDLDAAVNAFRLFVDAGRLKVHPRCVQTVAHLDYGVWANKKRKVFAESGEEGHFDLLACGIYLVRNLIRQRNPNPPVEVGLSAHDYMIPGTTPKQSKGAQALGAAMMGPARRAAARKKGKR